MLGLGVLNERWSMDIPQSDLERILQAGQLAKIKLFQSLIKKVKEEQKLSASELKAWGSLERELEAQLGGTDDPSVLIASFDEAAKYCGFSKRTLSHHIGKGNIKQKPDGTFDRSELDRFLSTRKGRKKTSELCQTVQEQKEVADLRYRLARARREEVLTAALDDGYLSKVEVEAGWTARVLELKSGLMNWKDRLVPKLLGKSAEEMRRILYEETWQLLDQYAREGQFCKAQGLRNEG